MAFDRPFYRWRPHPWHGIDPGPNAPQIVRSYVEITPFDLVKYEIDKETGYVRVDRLHRGSSQPPTMYGFVPQTYCGQRVADLSPKAIQGDGDPIDICVICERPITRGEIIVDARIVGGLQAVDRDEADDKLVAVLSSDPIYANVSDLPQLPKALVDRLVHYFGTYKMLPGGENQLTIEEVYGVDRALDVLQASLDDYDEAYGR